MLNIHQQLLAENARLRKMIDDRDETTLITPFVQELSNSIMIMLAMTPEALWPDFAKTALTEVTRKSPTASALYRARLPQIRDEVKSGN